MARSTDERSVAIWQTVLVVLAAPLLYMVLVVALAPWSYAQKEAWFLASLAVGVAGGVILRIWRR